MFCFAWDSPSWSRPLPPFVSLRCRGCATARSMTLVSSLLAKCPWVLSCLAVACIAQSVQDRACRPTAGLSQACVRCFAGPVPVLVDPRLKPPRPCCAWAASAGVFPSRHAAASAPAIIDATRSGWRWGRLCAQIVRSRSFAAQRSEKNVLRCFAARRRFMLRRHGPLTSAPWPIGQRWTPYSSAARTPPRTVFQIRSDKCSKHASFSVSAR